MDINEGALLIAGIIAAIPSIAIAVLGFSLRSNESLSKLVASNEAQEKTLARFETTLREERDKRDELEKVVYGRPKEIADEYVKREDFVRNAGQVDHKLDALNCRIEALRPSPDSHC